VNPPPHSLLALREIVDYIEVLHAEGRNDEIPREVMRVRGVLLDLEEELGSGVTVTVTVTAFCHPHGQGDYRIRS
jgi:hypothetical protein